MSNKKALFLDFDGVIADSRNVIYSSVCNVSEARRITPPSIEDLQNNSSSFLFNHLKLKWYEVPFVVRKLKRLVAENQKYILVYPEIIFLLKIARENFDSIFILSSNSKQFIIDFLTRNNLLLYFDGIYGDVAFFRKSSYLNSISKENTIDKINSIYLGDETRDIEAAKTAQMISVAVTWGVHSRNNLASKSPDFIIDTPIEFSKIINRNKF